MNTLVAFGNWNFQIISVRISHFSRSIIESFQSTTEANELRFSRGCWRSEQELLCKQRLKIVLTHIKTHISSLESQMIGVNMFLLATISTIKHKQFDVIIVYTSPRPLPPLIIASRFSFIRLLRRSEAMCHIWKLQFPNTAIVCTIRISGQMSKMSYVTFVKQLFCILLWKLDEHVA